MKSTDVKESISSLLAKYSDILICPACGQKLHIQDNDLACMSCGKNFQCRSGIPHLFCPNNWEDSRADVTDAVKDFYEETPFPNYEDIDSTWTLRGKARKGIVARMLDDQILPGSLILEVGCGTGQLTNFLGATYGRTVFGTDICLNSLRLGEEFRKQNQIENVGFVQMNLFRPIFRPESFDVVICNGVLHHTSNPFGGFLSISALVKRGGYILLGLYNTYGRIPTHVRRILFRVFGHRFHFFDSRLRDRSLSKKRKHIWFMDQYKNPHESTHTMGEVLGWFDKSGFEYTNSIPKSTAFEPFSPDEKLFKGNPRGTGFDRFFVQLSMLWKEAREGGLFMMIGRRKS